MNIHLLKQYEQQQNFHFDQEQQTLNKLSYHMKNKLVTQSNKNIIKQLKFLDSFSQNTLSSMYQIMQEECYSEGQIINTFDTQTLDSYAYLITQGKVIKIFFGFEVEILKEFQFDENNEDLTIQYQNDFKRKSDEQNSGKKVIRVLNVGEYFGECEFFSNSPLPYIVRCQKHTTVIKIHTSQFLEIVKKNKQDYQKYQEIKHKILLNKEIFVIQSKCIICSSLYHHFIDCPVTHYFKKSKISLFRYLHCPNQQRDEKFVRKREKQAPLYDDITSRLSVDENKEDTCSVENDLSDRYEESGLNDGMSFSISQKYISKGLNFESEVIKEEDNDDESQKQNLPNKSQESIKVNSRNNISSGYSYIKSNTIGHSKNSQQASKQVQQRQSLRQSLLHRRSQNLNHSILENINNQDCKEMHEKPILKEKIQKQPSLSKTEQGQQQTLITQKSTNKFSIFDLLKKQINSSIQQLDSNYSERDDKISSMQEVIQKMSQSNLSNGQRNSLQHILKQNVLLNQQFQMNSYTYGLETLLKVKWDNSMYYWDFDKKCDFLYFFPHHNFKHVFKKVLKKYMSQKDKKRIGFRKSFQVNANIK